MTKRPSRGVTSGIGSPRKVVGRDGDLTIRKTHDGKILYVKEKGEWHQLTTGIDIAQLKKDVDRLINSAHALKRDVLNPYPNKRSLAISHADDTGVKFVNDSGVLKVRNLADTADAILKAKRLQVDSSTSGVTGAVVGEYQFNSTGNAFYLHGEGLVLDAHTTGTSGDIGVGAIISHTADSLLKFFDGSTIKWSIGYDQSDSNKFKIHNATTLADTSDFMLDTSGNLALAGGLASAGVQTITSTTADQLKVLYDGSNYGLMNVADDGHLEIESVGTDADMTLNAAGDIELNADLGTISFKDAAAAMAIITAGRIDSYFDLSNYTRIGTDGNGVCTINTNGGTPANADFTVDAGGDITLDSGTGLFIAKVAGTEFSAANSAYAGMILGYTCVGNDAADDSYSLTTSYVCFLDSGGTEISVTFKTPPSEYVEIEVSLYFTSGSAASDLKLSLSNNANYGSNSFHHSTQFEKTVCTPARGNGGTIVQKWLMKSTTLEAVGSSNTVYIAAASDSTTGTPAIKWSGDIDGDPTALFMKATALPATIGVGS